MRKIFKIKSLRFSLGIVLGIISFFLNVLLFGQVRNGIIFFILFICVGAFNMKEQRFSDKDLKIFLVIWFGISASFIFFCSQMLINEGIFTMGTLKVLLNIGIYLLLFVMLYIITLMPILSVDILSIGMILISIANHFVFQFRGTELKPTDFLAINTAKNVAAEYKFTIDRPLLYGILLFVIYLFLNSGLPKIKIRKRWKMRGVSTGILVGLFIILLITVKIFSIKPMYWSQRGSNENGYLLNFVLQLQNAIVTEPRGYSIDLIDEVANKYKQTSSSIMSAEEEDDNPDIIVIMDESFVDFRILNAKININQSVLPFIDSMHENIIQGYALSSVYGGMTPNSEYEVLSGNSLFFLPQGSVVYSQYLKNPTYSMVSDMKNKGYKCISLHPFAANGWERPRVYPNLGFDESFFIDDFLQKDIVREFVSDQECFEKVTELYEENKKQDQNVFMFGVTMQNHGGYEYSGENFEQTIQLNGYKNDYEEAEQYLSLIHETDQAVKYLIEYFEKVNDEVVLVFYGDHFPNLNREFYEEIYGGEFNSLDEQQLLYKVPFFIWTNYDIEEKNVELTSLNYLSNYIYDVSGLPMPEYNKVLWDIQKKIPALNANGYYSMEQKRFLTYSEAVGEEAEVLDMYNQLQYNSLFDKENRNKVLFPEIKE